MKLFYIAICILFLSACASVNKTEPLKQTIPIVSDHQNETIPSIPETPKKAEERISLSWEDTTESHPERAPWSDSVLFRIESSFQAFDAAKDISQFCPKYKSLDHKAKLKAWGELWVALAYYESGYDPTSSSVDVGSRFDKDTWSIGLFQMSVVDQQSYKLPLGYKFSDLLKPIPNIHLATAVMAQQITKKGLIVVSSNPYWATLYRGRYSQIDNIIARVKKKSPGCL